MSASSHRLETLFRIRDRLGSMSNPNLGELSEDRIKPYEELLNRLQELGEDVEDFRIVASDWKPARMRFESGGLATVYTGPLDGTEELVVSKAVFKARLLEAYRFVERTIERERSEVASQKKTPTDILDERNHVLATLVDAYLQDQSDIHVLGADGGLHFHHPGLPKGFTTNLSHLEALGRSGKIILTPGSKRSTWKIGIPDALLTELHQQDQHSMEEPHGPSRIEEIARGQVLQQYFFGGSHNVAQGSSDFSQSIEKGVRAGDLPALIRALQDVGITDQGIDQLKAALRSDEEEAGQRTVGKRVRGFFAELVQDTAGKLVSSEATKALPQIIDAVQAFVG